MSALFRFLLTEHEMPLCNPVSVALIFVSAFAVPAIAQETIDFNTDIRPIISNKCFACHGPDEENLEADLRLDDRKIATSELDSGSIAIVAGKPDQSELIARITSEDEDLRMPPASFGKPLTADEAAKVKLWIKQGAEFARHWSYVKPVRHAAPQVPAEHKNWPNNTIDNFTLRAMLAQGLKPSPTANRRVLARRLSLDLTGLPPSVEETEAFVTDKDPQAYEHFVDSLLNKQAFGEHWARKWLDLARYADSAGYADDPKRTIWAYRDWVIKSINANMPFDQFTIEQMAGDLLSNPTQDQLIATAFHRNTLTNNEGGTQDEEFRNVAVVDRVNTTMAVWMGTTMACAQCHTHKYDPITQEEYFRFFAILNSTEDADRRNEAPTITVFTDQQKSKRTKLKQEIASLESVFKKSSPQLVAAQQKWETSFRETPEWTVQTPSTVSRSSGKSATIQDDASVLVSEAVNKDVYTVELPIKAGANIAGLQLQTIPHASLPSKGTGHGGGNFVITGLKAQLTPEKDQAPVGRYLRITNNGKGQILSLAEVQIMSSGANIATQGTAKQHSTGFAGPAALAIDGNTDGNYEKGSVTHTLTVDNPWWEVDLGDQHAVESVSVWNRTDNGLQNRLRGFTIQLLDGDRTEVWTTTVADAPNPSSTFAASLTRDIPFITAFADYEQPDFTAAEVLKFKAGPKDGWAVGGATTSAHQLVAVPKKLVKVEQPSVLRIRIEQNSPHLNHLLGHFRIATTSDTRTIQYARAPKELLAVLQKQPTDRTQAEQTKVSAFYRRRVAPLLAKQRSQLAKAERTLAALKPATTVPILRELKKPRETRLQHRGNYLDKGQVVVPGTPAAFHPAPNEKLDRLAMAKWLVHQDNPLTARVIANRYWESLFGRGIVLSSEEFGSQGELPTHPQLLDWLATELVASGWNTRDLIRKIVMSATYQQASVVDSNAIASDADNRWLARGPRVRLTAEMVRDQALFASGLLSQKAFGPPVQPPQPSSGLTAAFGGSTDWKTSTGEDRYRRGLYTMWRRSNPYPSMATFDAPNREVCTVRRNSTNTPLQSLVTLNDPVYVEAAQSLARLVLKHAGGTRQQIAHGFKRCTLREPGEDELAALISLFEDSRKQLAQDADAAKKLATVPLGMLPKGIDTTDAAAMTVVANVLLNLDEMFLKR